MRPIDMPATITDLLHQWHDFYVLIGTASATLVGLTFVAASIGAQVFREENRAGVEAFISPTVVHFGTALFISFFATIPVESGLPLTILLVLFGAAGFGFSARIWVQILVRRSFKVDVIDQLFYALVPCLGHLLVPIAATLLIFAPALGLDCLAGATLTLLFAGIRNAWDMTIWVVLKTPVAGPTNEPPQS
jgi:hypothetical protein